MYSSLTLSHDKQELFDRLMLRGVTATMFTHEQNLRIEKECLQLITEEYILTSLIGQYIYKLFVESFPLVIEL